jgi:hypothetical protein
MNIPALAAQIHTDAARMRAGLEPVEPPKRLNHYRDQAIAADRAGYECEIPLQHIAMARIGMGTAGTTEEERGTLFCTRCLDYPDGCKGKATAERLQAFEAHLDSLRRNNLSAAAETAKYAPIRNVEADYETRRRGRM